MIAESNFGQRLYAWGWQAARGRQSEQEAESPKASHNTRFVLRPSANNFVTSQSVARCEKVLTLGGYMPAKKDSCFHKMVCWRWNGEGAECSCIEDCIHYTAEALKPSPNTQSMSALEEAFCAGCGYALGGGTEFIKTAKGYAAWERAKAALQNSGALANEPPTAAAAPCKHEFLSDGTACTKCGLTWIEL